MPLVDYLQYKVGYVPRQDVQAQKRCFDYLVATIEGLEKLETQHPSQNTKNLIQMYSSVRNLAQNTEGSAGYTRAQSFWNSWDRYKDQIIQIKENTDDDIDVQKVLEVLEDGRYIAA